MKKNKLTKNLLPFTDTSVTKSSKFPSFGDTTTPSFDKNHKKQQIFPQRLRKKSCKVKTLNRHFKILVDGMWILRKCEILHSVTKLNAGRCCISA